MSEKRSHSPFAFLKKRQHPDVGEALAMDIDYVSTDGVIKLGIYDAVSGGDRKGEVLFSLDERLRLRATSSGRRLEKLDIHRVPVEE